MEKERIWGWHGISLVLGVHESTAQRWSSSDPTFRKLLKRYGHRIFAYRTDLLKWQTFRDEALDIERSI